MRVKGISLLKGNPGWGLIQGHRKKKKPGPAKASRRKK